MIRPDRESSPARPPRWGHGLIAFGVSPARRAEIIGDLEERFKTKARTEGRRRALVWYLKQAAAFAITGSGARLRSAIGLGWEGEREGWLAASVREFRLASRSLLRTPGISGTTVLTLALGIGGVTTVFGVVDRILLRPLPFPESEELVAIRDTFQGGVWWSGAPLNVRSWREGSRALSDLGWAQPAVRSLLRDGDAVELSVQQVSANLLDVLGVEVERGPGFSPDADRRGGPAVAILTHAFWTRLGARESIVGESIVLDDIPFEVVGILPVGGIESVLDAHDLLVPRVFTAEEEEARVRILTPIGRLSAGASVEDVKMELERILTEGGEGEGWGVDPIPLRDQIVGSVRPALLLILGAVGFVLVVAVVNVSNLLLARGSARDAELSTRRMLGAGRARLARQLLIESSILSGAGAIAGVAVSFWAVGLVSTVTRELLPRSAEIGIDLRVLGLSLLVAAGTGVLAALAPMIRTAGRSALGSGGARSTSDRRTIRMRTVLVTVQVAFVLVLLAGAGLMWTSFERLRSVDPGFPVEDRLVLRLNLPDTRFANQRAVGDFFVGLSSRARELPGVLGAGSISHAPLASGDWTGFHIVESLPSPAPGEEPIGGMEIAGPGYFDALGVPIVAGREFRAEDAWASPPVAVVDQPMVDRFWSDSNPIGDRVRIGPEDSPAQWRTVIGVVGAVDYALGALPRPRVYLPDSPQLITSQSRSVVVHVEPGRLDAAVPELTALVREMAPQVPIASLRTMEEVASGSLARARLQTYLVGVFGVVALLLGAIGVYGVVSYGVARRTREVGVRIALGARHLSLLRRILLEAMTPVLVGVGLGLLATRGLGRFVDGVLYEIDATDPVVLSLVAFLLIAVAFLAALTPGLRATRIDPVETLRIE